MKSFYRGLISATSKSEAKEILAELTSQKLVAGGLISEGLSVYWWKEELVEKVYFNISVFTDERNKGKVIEQVKSMHSDDVPIIAFFEIVDANEEFLFWIDESTRKSLD